MSNEDIILVENILENLVIIENCFKLSYVSLNNSIFEKSREKVLEDSKLLLENINENNLIEEEFMDYLEIHNILNCVLKNISNLNINVLNLVKSVLLEFKEFLISKNCYLSDGDKYRNVYDNFESKFLKFQSYYYIDFFQANSNYAKECMKISNVLEENYLR